MDFDRTQYKVLVFAKFHTFQCEIDKKNPAPETSNFIIFGEDEIGTKFAVSIPVSELGDLPKASASAAQQFPEGRRIH